MSPQQQKNMQEIKIELEGKIGEGAYSNLVIIAHSDSEFILDFATFLPGNPSARVHSRIIMTPKHAKLLLHSLKQNIGQFEEQFGEIRISPQESFIGGDGRPVAN
ncbi:MAG TPA: DUF3467 domain-containing protein [Spirochaetota bacterium]|nr:DUF3467 domain-containing protein [Spirochaetota bacterium]HPN81931.1 DUF3467 domain-containing protein [Spirochaetota bacterium]